MSPENNIKPTVLSEAQPTTTTSVAANKKENKASYEDMVNKDTYALLRGHDHKLSREENITLFKRCIYYFKPYKVRVGIATLMMCIVSLCAAGEAYLIKPAMDEIFINKNTEMLILVPIFFVLVTLLKVSFRFGQNYLMQYSGLFVLQKLREEMFNKIVCLPMKFYENNQVGKLMALVLNDVGTIRNSLPALVMIVRQIFTMFALIGVVFYQDAKLAFWAVLVLPLCFLPFFYFGSTIRKLARNDRTNQDDVSIALQEIFSGIKIVKAFVTQEEESKSFAKKNQRIMKLALKQTVFSETTSSTMELIGALGVSVVIFYGGMQVVSGESTPGTFFSFVAAIIMLYDPVKKLSDSNNGLQSALAGAERVFMILDSPVLKTESGGELVFNKDKNDDFQTLEFKDISLRYAPDLPLALNKISFTLKKGEKIALVGPSGAGKTSFVNLISRFYEPESGQILLNGADLREYTLDSLRKNVAMVSQDSFLFNLSVTENICYGDDLSQNQEAIHAAAKAAYAHDFILNLADGYNTLVGERGVKLSGGQKQRITIARALFKNSPLLILDEATSALDSESEQVVQKALENLMENRTSIVIAHRLSTILSSDRIFVMDKGNIVAIGSHEELLESSELYAKLYSMQFKAAL